MIRVKSAATGLPRLLQAKRKGGFMNYNFTVVGFQYGADDNVSDVRNDRGFNVLCEAWSRCDELNGDVNNDGWEYRVIHHNENI